MNSKIYRCGWCGYPTDKDGNTLHDEPFEKAKKIIDTYGDGEHTHLVNGSCCPNGNYEPEYIRVTRDMALDAQDPSLEGELWRWS
jgi:hypothetical protein